MLKRWMSLILALVMSLSLMACGGSEKEEAPAQTETKTEAPATDAAAEDDITKGDKVNIKWYCILPDNNPTVVAYQKIFDEIEEETAGRIKFEMSAGGVLGTEQEGFDMIRDGTVQGGMMNNSYYESYVPESQGWMMPYTFTDYATALAYFNDADTIADWNGRIESTTNTVAINAVSPGFRSLTSNVPVYTPADAAGLQIRSMESPMSQAYVSILGGTPVPLAWAEVYMGLSTGAIDGQENPVAHISTYNLYEVQDYLCFTEHAFLLCWSIFNVDFWNSLSAKDQAYLIEKFAEEAEISLAEVNRGTEETFAALESEHGMTVLTEEDGLDKNAFVEYADKYLNDNFTAAEYDGWWEFRNAATAWCEANG